MTNSYLQTVRMFSRDVWLFLVAASLVGFAWDGTRTVLFNLYLLRLGHGPEFVGLVSAVGALAFALCCLPAGALGTRWTSRSALIVGVSLLLVGYSLVPLVEFVPATWQRGWLLAATVLTHLGFSIYLVNSLPFLMGVTLPKERSHVFSVQMALIPLAAFVGSLVGGSLPGVLSALSGASSQDPAAYRYTLLLGAMLLVPAVLALLPTRAVDGEGQSAHSADRSTVSPGRAPLALILIMALVMAFRFGGRGAVTTFFNVYLDDGLGVSTSLIGALVASAQLLSVPAALAAPVLVARSGELRTITLGMLGMAFFVLPLALIPHWGAAGLSLVISTAFFSATSGPMQLYSQELVERRWQATMAAAFMMGPGLAFAATSLAGGIAIATVGYTSLFVLAAGLIALATLLFWVYFRVPRGELACRAASEIAG